MTAPAHGKRRGLLALAAVTLWWERLWPQLWPVAAVIALFVGLALLDVLPLLPGWMHGLVLAAFLAALVATLRRAWKSLRPIAIRDARHRIERDSGLVHRPLTALSDRMTVGNDDPTARTLWRAHRQRMAAAARNLHVRLPEPGMAQRDPWGLRAGVLLFLVIGLAAGYGDAGNRLARALVPTIAAVADGPVAVEMWITPPAYTGVAPLFLQHTTVAGSTAADDPETVTVPAGSMLLAQTSGLLTSPILTVGDEESPFQGLGDGSASHRAEATVAAGDQLAITAAGRTIATWPLDVVPDVPPSVAFATPPEATQRAFLRLSFTAADDYGVADVAAVVRRVDGALTLEGQSDLRLPLPLIRENEVTAAGQTDHDLTAHVWAGADVTIQPEATDAAGQVGRGEAVAFRLPERLFEHPVAQAIVAQRKHLDRDDRAVRAAVSAQIASIAAQPGHYAYDTVVSLALSVARARLVRDGRPGAVASVRDLLWDAALRVEGGGVPVAERALREARQRLWEALRGDATDEVIERLIDELQDALDRYMAALRAEMARQGQTPPPANPDAQVIHGDDLHDLIEMAREFARTGARDSARQLLAELQRMLDGLRSGTPSSRSSQELVEAHRLMNELRALAQRQEELLNDTQDRLRALREQRDPRTGLGQRQPSQPGQWAPPTRPGADDGRGGQTGQGGSGAQNQESLRGDLRRLMPRFSEFLGAIPAPLRQADGAMRGAGAALRAQRLGGAARRQGEALNHLRQGTDAAAEALAQQLGGMAGMFSGDPDEADEDGTDPFGRGAAGGFRGMGFEGVKIPDRMELLRAREILQELRRRANDRSRPTGELEYIDRLLRRF